MNKELSAHTSLSHYRIVAPLGAGGMGEVYLAEDERLRRKIALKMLPESLAQDKDRLRRFEQEAVAASALNHPNILTIYEFGVEGETHFLAAEFIDGETLRDRLQRSPLSLNEAVDIAVQTAQALAAAHKAHIIHRDIKPENVMLRKDGIVKVLDFGLAKLTETRKSQRGTQNEEEVATLLQDAPNLQRSAFSDHPSTIPGTVMGTVAYMSPEQARGNPVDARTDLFSLGVMLYEMLARRQPFTGETINHVIVAILEQEPPPLATELPAELARILQQMLAKKADERYASAQALLADLKKLQMRLLLEAEHERPSSSDESDATQTLMLKPTTAAAPEALATADSGQQTTNPPSAIRHPKSKWQVALLSLLVLIGGFFGYRYFSTAKPIESIAVMPFVNESGNAEVEYLSDGMTETLISSLSNLPNLSVKARSTVFYYKGKETSPQKIGEELKVQAVLLGRVAQHGNDLKLSLELVNTQTQDVIWSEQYNRKQTDLVTLQSEIARDVSGKLKTRLSGAEEAKVTKNYTANPEAYQLYLKGNYHFARRTKNDIQKGIEYFDQAVKLDPNFALAFVGIANSYNSMVKNSDLLPKEAIPQAKAAAIRSLEIDPTLAEAHAALADSLALDWNWTEAKREFEKAIELNSNVAYTHVAYGTSYLVPMGRTDEAVLEIKRAVELEPLSLINNAVLASVQLYARQNDQALEQARKTYDLDPNFRFGQQWLGQAYIANGQLTEAITFSEKVLQAFPFAQENLPTAGQAYAKSNRRREAGQCVDKLKELSKTQPVRSYWIAAIYAALGDKDNAFAELEKAYQERDWFLPRIKVDPIMDGLRDEARYQDLLKRMKLSE